MTRDLSRICFARSLLAVCVCLGLAIDARSSGAETVNVATRYPYSRHKQMTHRAMETVLAELGMNVDEKITKKWKAKLNWALLYQDIFNFFRSKVHFDNCNFIGGIEHINDLRRGIDHEYAKLINEKSRKKREEVRENIVFRIGRISHSIQDFYSHSNFVELQNKRHKELRSVPVPDFWNRTGQAEILRLVDHGLVSHRYFWSFPRKCKGKSPGRLHKDEPYDRAAKQLTVWTDDGTERLTVYEASIIFAEESTKVIFRELFRDLPLLTREA